MLNIIFSAMNGWHSGRGIKFAKQQDYQRSLEHFLSALKYARKTGNVGTIATDLESLAKIYHALGREDLAINSAQESHRIFKDNIQLGSSFKAGAKRLNDLLNNLERNLRGS